MVLTVYNAIRIGDARKQPQDSSSVWWFMVLSPHGKMVGTWPLGTWGLDVESEARSKW